MQELYAHQFNSHGGIDDPTIKKIHRHLKKIDQAIIESAPTWPIEKINKVDLAILRLAVFELIVEGKTPPKVTVDEAVELAKQYGSETSAAFINGALGKLITDHHIPTSWLACVNSIKVTVHVTYWTIL